MRKCGSGGTAVGMAGQSLIEGIEGTGVFDGRADPRLTRQMVQNFGGVGVGGFGDDDARHQRGKEARRFALRA